MKWKIGTAFFFLTFIVLLLALPDNVKWLGEPYQPTTAEDIRPHRDTIKSQAERLKPGVVTLTGTGFGTGFIAHEDGYVFTNAHVVGDAEKMQVSTYGGREYTAETVAVSGYNRNRNKVDFAILKVNETMENVTALEFGNSSNVEKGDIAFNIGHPGRYFNWAILAGEVYRVKQDEIEVDKPGGVGESGSPLFNLQGKVIGIVSEGKPAPSDEQERLDSADEIVIWNGNKNQYRTRSLTGAETTQRMHQFTKQELGTELANEIFK